MTTVHGSDKAPRGISKDQVSVAASDDEKIICVTGFTGVYSPHLHQKLFGHGKNVEHLLQHSSPPKSPPEHAIRSPTNLEIMIKQQQKIDDARFHAKKEKFAELVLKRVEDFSQIRNQHTAEACKQLFEIQELLDLVALNAESEKTLESIIVIIDDMSSNNRKRSRDEDFANNGLIKLRQHATHLLYNMRYYNRLLIPGTDCVDGIAHSINFLLQLAPLLATPDHFRLKIEDKREAMHDRTNQAFETKTPDEDDQVRSSDKKPDMNTLDALLLDLTSGCKKCETAGRRCNSCVSRFNILCAISCTQFSAQLVDYMFQKSSTESAINILLLSSNSKITPCVLQAIDETNDLMLERYDYAHLSVMRRYKSKNMNQSRFEHYWMKKQNTRLKVFSRAKDHYFKVLLRALQNDENMSSNIRGNTACVIRDISKSQGAQGLSVIVAALAEVVREVWCAKESHEMW